MSDSWGFAGGDAITDALTCLRKLGGGSSYEAYLAFDQVTYSPVVVKLVRPARVDDPSTLRGLRREVAMLDRVRHPAVVRMLRATAEGARPHVVLEQLDGPRLSSLVRKHGPLAEQQYLPMAIELASALHYLHGNGLVHLDVKPSNIIMGAPAKLIDLSVAQSVDDAAATTYAVGTDRYMSPEQCALNPVPASDVWGLGAVLFEAVAGYRAFDDSDVVWPQVTDDPFDLPERTPPDLAKIVFACLEHDPGNRPTPAEVADSLGPLLERSPRGQLAGWRPTR